MTWFEDLKAGDKIAICAVGRPDAGSLDVVDVVPQLARNRTWCRQCGASRSVDSRSCLSTGWPKCCGYTMTIDSPDEQASGDQPRQGE